MEPSANKEEKFHASSVYSCVGNWHRNLPQEVSALRKQVQGMETEHLRLRDCLNCLSDTVKLLVCQSRKAQNYLPQNYLPQKIHRCANPGAQHASRSALDTEILHLYDRRTPAPHNSPHPHSSGNRPRSVGLPDRPRSVGLPVRESEALPGRPLTASIYTP
jgi:hypothetical protein